MSLCLNWARSGQDIVWLDLKIIWNAKRDVGERWAKKIWGDAMCNCITEIMGRRRREDKTIRHFLSHFVRENKDVAWLIISNYCFYKAKHYFVSILWNIAKTDFARFYRARAMSMNCILETQIDDLYFSFHLKT